MLIWPNKGNAAEYHAAIARSKAGTAFDDDQVILSHAISRGVEGLSAKQVAMRSQLLLTGHCDSIDLVSSDTD